MAKKINKARVCRLCSNNIKTVDYKDVKTLRQFISSFLKIAPRRRSGLCAKHQRQASRAIKQARIAGLIAFIPK
ncbi:30S ribosomal protein S18 [Patescibacteria group bacterium]|nr:30S ribosomal protein S18 [Patescibacteria group bacterium]MBU1721262.1 30S ribosomal protein S18 [Patescibacteria group bacterium]MBU1901030.1 30S ribosomal protein S18 [Patescibacteria group bacterium]